MKELTAPASKNTFPQLDFYHLRALGSGITSLKNENNGNIFHHIATSTRLPFGLMHNIRKIISEADIQALSLATDNSGRTPLEYARNPENIRTIFSLIPKKERLSRLVDENNLLREHFQTAADELHAESGTYLLNLMRSLSKRDQLKFLTAQFSQTTSIIKHLLDDNDIKKS